MEKVIKTLKILLYALSMCIFIISCNHLEEGVVVGKRYEESSSDLVLIPMKIGNATILQQYWTYDNEDWIVVVKGDNGSDTVTETVYVTKECYESLDNGDIWRKTDDCSFSDDNNSKVKKYD